jgi:hypothetical protein
MLVRVSSTERQDSGDQSGTERTQPQPVLPRAPTGVPSQDSTSEDGPLRKGEAITVDSTARPHSHTTRTKPLSPSS